MNAPTLESVQVELDQAIAEILTKDLQVALNKHEIGHCLQVTDLPASLMEHVCRKLRSQEANEKAEVYVLTNDTPREWEITSTRLVARRNAEESVILVFLPPEIRTSAEDSLDVSTFERVPLGNLYARLRIQLTVELSDKFQQLFQELVGEALFDSDLAVCRYLLASRNVRVSRKNMGLVLPFLGLIPDAALPEDTRPRLLANKEAVRTLSNPRSSLFEKIQGLGLKPGRTPNALYRMFTEIGSIDPARWLPAILDDAFVSDLTFDQWEFARSVQGQIDQILFKSITPLFRERDLEYPIFRMQQEKGLKIVWETVPPPLQCDELEYFTVELMKDDAPATEARTVRVGTSSRKERSTTFKDLTKNDLEEGLYYVRVSAWGEGGRLMKDAKSESFLIESIPIDDQDPTGKDDETVRRTAVASIYEAKLRTQIKLREREKSVEESTPIYQWQTPEKRMGGRYTDEFSIAYNNDNLYVLPVNAMLRRFEQETLGDADNLGRWQLDLTVPRSVTVTPELQEFEGIEFERLENFLNARRDLFSRIVRQSQGEIEFLVETSDVLIFAEQIIAYATAYIQALTQLQSEVGVASAIQRRALLKANRQITSIDTIELKLPDGQFAYLMAPTHPLKLLWSLQYARAAVKWQEQIRELPIREAMWSTFETFVPRLMSLNIPNALTDRNGQLLINADNISPFWSIFVPAITQDVRTIVGRIKTLLGSPETDERFTTITGSDLARKVLDYLEQHSYVSTLIINAVQPGSGAILEDLLVELESQHPNLHYKVHLFAESFHPEELGAALDEMMLPTVKRSGSDALDAFVTPSGNALFPKLVYSKHRLAEFFERPTDFEAHITFLFDAFSVNIGFAEPLHNRRSNYLYGLIHQYASVFSTKDAQIAWQRQIVLGDGLDVDGKFNGHQTLVELEKRYTAFLATVALPELGSAVIPTLHLVLGPNDKNLVSQAHQVSDWVLTIDPNFGIEYLDSPYDEHCPAYLIDYQPEYLGQIGHRLLVSTQHLYEIERMVQPILRQLGLPDSKDDTREFVNALRSISGRLVLKLISSRQMANGALGMAVARLFLEEAGLLQDMILISLDSHPDLFTTARRESEQRGQSLSLRRTDMLLVEIATETRTLTFHLIEVKFRTAVGQSTLRDLKGEILLQLENSAQVLQQFYDPDFRDADRFDRPVRSQELVTLLEFYLERAERYQLIAPQNLEAMRTFLENLEQGYSLQVTRAGVILNLQAIGYQTEAEENIIFHQLGMDSIQKLLASAHTFTTTGTKSKPDPAFSTTRETFTHHQVQIITHTENVEPTFIEIEELSAPNMEMGASGGVSAQAPFIAGEEKTRCDILLGARHSVQQFGLLGRKENRTVGLDLNGTNVISLFGVPGSGKSYTLGNILEMAVMPIPGINQLPNPLGAVVFHYDKESYKPEFVTMTRPNFGAEADLLSEIYHARATGLPDVLVLVPEGKLVQRQHEFPDLSVQPIHFDTTELDLDDWKFLMGVVGSEAMYVRKMEQVFRKMRNNLTINGLYQGIAGAGLNSTQTALAKTRIDFAKEFIRDGEFLQKMLHPGRMIIVDLRDELIEKEQALGLFVVMLKILAKAEYQSKRFNKLIVFDEAHKYLGTHLAKEVEEVVRQMRHLGTTVLIASQDPPSVPVQIISLSSQIILHKFNSPLWLQHLQKSVIALKELGAGRLNMLSKGQAYIWSSEATDPEFTSRAVKVEMRPRVTEHGGGTLTAL